jgi:poly(3-hydroxybutyrate) depolymerase
VPVLSNQLIAQGGDRTYHVHVPANPAQATVPAIVVFHGDGQDAATIARRWGLEPGSPIPANVADYLLVFPRLIGACLASGFNSRSPTVSSRPSTWSSSTCSCRS